MIRTIRYTFALTGLLLTLNGTLRAAEWVDLTDLYLNNPRFANNSNSGWTMEAYAGSTACNYGCQEFWQGYWNFYQTINLPNGHYRISVYGYHRPTNNSNAEVENYNNGNGTEITSYLYANDDYTPLANIYSHSLSSNLYNGCWDYSTGYGPSRTYVCSYPNTMETASYCFGQGMYYNELETDVTNGTLTVGIRNNNYVNNNWSIFTNWKLEWYGDKVLVESITFPTKTIQIVEGESRQLTPIIEPANATLPKLSWSSSNEAKVTVDQNGVVTAVASVGRATITATATDGSGIKGTCTVVCKDNSAALANVKITEIQNANIDQIVDPSWNYGNWVELYNPSTLGVTLTGCWISDDPDNLTKVHISQPIAIPAEGYLNLWFEHHDKYCLTQLDMKLNMEGGIIYLSDKNGSIITSQEYLPAVSRCSYARKSLDSDEWGVSPTPTPEASNEGMTYSEDRLPAPVVDQPSQIFSNTLTVCVNIPTGATLRYTTDGSTPTATNGETSYDGLFYPDETTTYRFCLVGDGYLPSQVVTRTYIYEDKTFALPVISVVTDDQNLYSDELGVLTRGVNGRPGNGQATACNWNMDWDRPINFEFINEEGEMVINQETAMERCGGWSRAWTPYSFKIKANKRYELQNTLPYQFFPEKPYRKHKTLQIRNGGNDTSCRIKDPALQEIVFRSGIDIDCQAYQPVMHYINGRYAGVINMREPNNKHYVYANYGLEDDEIDQFEMSPDSGYVQKCGTYESMQRWYNLAKNCADNETYEEIKRMVDIDEFCNYMAVEFYLGGTDWPQNNVKGFKPIMDGGRFRFILFDLDGTFATNSPFATFAGKKNYTFDKLYGEDVSNITKEIELVTIFLNMLNNATFRKQFIDTFCLVAGSVFDPDRCEEIINELANRVDSSQRIWNEVYGGGSNPWSTANSLISNLSSSRQTSMISTMRSYSPFNLSLKTAQSVQLSANIEEARLLVNDLPVPTNKFKGQLFAPITFKAQAPVGYKFTGWKLVEGTSNNASTLIPTESEWKYYDQGSLDGINWTASNYDDSAWDSGQAPLGYYVGGDRYTNTFLDYGGNTNSKRPTYYFRKSITLSETPSSEDVFTLDFIIDDGYIIYVNGTEAGRYNMPSGTITYSSFATSYAPNNPDSGSQTLDASLFKRGTNVIAVEIHNNSANSTDIYWEGSLTHSSTSTEGNIICADEEYEMPSSGNMVLEACYEEMTDAEKEEADIVTTPIVINEISAGNSIYVNDYFKKDDWVELYNTTNNDIDLEGMYMTDRSEKPTKYRITANGTHASTIIPAHGYKVIWCSKRNTQDELHANFKLDNVDGTVIRIMAADKSWADSIVYCAHNGDQTVGRYPDGGKDVYLMTQPTINATNQLNTYATAWEYVGPEDAINDVLSSRNGGMSIAYIGNQLLVKSEENQDVVVSVYTTAGVLVMYQGLNLGNGHDRVSVASLQPGIYVARVKDSEGNECATKFIKGN
ncbi:MAG: CotH kinase family protein [Bacteroidaceae bacterium]|nr:CotH kinase family protein [Bacteroidaceae bacterium]